MSTANASPALATVQPAMTAVVRDTVPTAELAGFYDDVFRRLPLALAAQQVTITGAAFALHHHHPLDETAELEVGFPTDRAVSPDGGVVPGSLPGGRVVRAVHAGGFDGLGDAWQRLASWIEDEGLTPSQQLWEVYLTESSPDMDPADLRTELIWPVAD